MPVGAMHVLLISNLYAPEPSGVGPYSAGLAAALTRLGHRVDVVCANPSYPFWKPFDGFPRWRWSRRSEEGATVHRCPVYVPRRVSGATRILHYASFVLSAVAPVCRILFGARPDVVMLVAPTLLAAPLALLAARIAGALSWLHVQDFEVEAGFATGQMQPTGYAAKAALLFERFSLRRFDQASSISAEMCRKLIDKGCAPEAVYELRNWASAALVMPQTDSSFRARWSIATPHVALYSGSIARKQGIGIILDAARRLRGRNDLTFVICGNGPERAGLEQEAASLPNVVIKDLQPFEQLGELLNLATVHLLPQRAGAADLVLPSKLTNMLASGRPIVATAAAGTGLAREVEGCGLIVPPEEPQAFADAIVTMLDEPERRARLGAEARARAEEAWDETAITGRFARRLSAVAEARRSARTRAT